MAASVQRATLDELRRALPKQERRVVPIETARLELRAAGDVKKIGMRVPFLSDSHLIYGFTERIAPGAFARTIKDGAAAVRGVDIVSLWNHDPNWVLGRQANKTLRLAETDEGLEGEATLDPANGMHDVFAANVARRDVAGASFGFETVKDEWKYSEDGSAERTLLEVRLFDVSPVTFPAYPASEAESRSAVDVAAVRVLVTRLETMNPSPRRAVDWDAKLRLRARVMGLDLPGPLPFSHRGSGRWR